MSIKSDVPFHLHIIPDPSRNMLMHVRIITASERCAYFIIIAVSLLFDYENEYFVSASLVRFFDADE